MKRRNFIKTISSSTALIWFNSCVATKELSRKRRRLLYSFIFSNDIHVTTDEHAQYFGESIQNWNSVSQLFDFVVICGDLANNGTSEELKLIKNHLTHLKKTFYPVVGNHDVSGPGEEGRKGYREVFGPDRENYIIFHKKTALVFLDLTNGTNAHIEIKKSSVEWLATALNSIPKKLPIIVFSHFPLHPEIPQYQAKNSSELFAVLDNRKILAYFSGHYHAKWQGTRNNIDFFGNTCMSLFRDNHDGTKEEGYLLARVYDSGVEVKFFERGKIPNQYLL